MAEERAQRRLAAVLAADVVGYSRLMGADEAGTLAKLKQLLADYIGPAIAEFNGRIVKLMGDGILAEFPSIVDAVECAVKIQRGLSERNADTREDQQITFRIGINLGDVIVDGDDIYGDGVNVAARLEGLAAPGGICVSEKVFAEVGNKLETGFEDLGPQEVKNIATPVRAYGVMLDAKQPTAAAAKPLELPDKPSIAVLPFDNMSGDPEQDYFADGIVEDLITDLSKISSLFVVARNSSAVYKGKPADISTVAKKLGVRHVLEGSVRKSGERVRINAQLIDAETGGHLWADRYDGSVADTFELQDQVCAQVVAALSVQLTSSETDNLRAIHTSNLDAYELFVRARATPYPPVPERLESARKMFEQVIELDPEFAGGYAGVSAMTSFTAMWSHEDTTDAIMRALIMAKKAIAMDATFGWSYSALGLAHLNRHEFPEAIAAGRTAITRRPNDADAHAFLGLILGLDGQYAPAIDLLNRAIRLNPLFVNGPYLNMRGQTQLLAENYQAAIDSYRENVDRGGPVGPPALCWGAAAYAGLGLTREAAQLTTDLRTNFPRFTMTNWNYLTLFRDATVRDRVVELMRKSGVPEG